MSSWTDVANALQKVIRVPLAATGFPSTKVYVGWPEPNNLLADLRTTPPGSRVHVSIYPWGDSKRTSRYIGDVQAFILAPVNELTVVNTNTLTVTIADGGTVGDNVFVFLNKYAFGTTMQTGDIGVNLAHRIANSITSANIGISATVIPGSPASIVFAANPNPVYALAARTFGQAIACTELGRAQRDFMVTVWAPTNATRDQVGNAIINVLNSVQFLTLSDGTQVRAVYDKDRLDDHGLPSGILRHDIFCMCEYPFLQTENVPLVAVPQLTLDVVWNTITTTLVIDGNPFGGSDVGSHVHIHEVPTGVRPGQSFTLTYQPIVGSEILYRNTLKLDRVGSNPGVNEYTINSQGITTGDVIQPTDDFTVHYEVKL